ncbi:hypothetical protein AB0G67_40135 [Streptomyces sp. NPDC021056]|uniref:hypothetical protein n=1 Tax=Streptomyces sp. NPDC021056 TaxID=3155012 RepID=UPI0033CF55A4
MPVQPDGELTQHQRLAAMLESKAAEIGRSLTDEATAAGLRIALKEMRRLLQGAHLSGFISDEGYRDLDTMVEAMMEAPGLLA